MVAYALWPQEGHWGRSLVFLGLLLIALALLILRSSSMVNNASGQDAVTLATTFAALIAGAVAIGCLLVGGTAWLLGK